MQANSLSTSILFLGCSTKAGYFVTKRFSKEGFLVHVLNWVDLPNKYSKYVHKYSVVPSPEKDLAAFKQELIKVVSETKFAAILPVHDAALEIVRVYRQELAAYCKVLGLNEDASYKYAHNKNTLLEEAKAIGLSVPKTILVKNYSELKAAAESMQYPCIVKPVSSAIIRNQSLYTFNVKKVETKEDLIDCGREIILNANLMLQEVVGGYGIGYNFFAENGSVKAAYIHKRINEYAGISSYRESLAPNHYGNETQLKELIAKSNWSGVGMIEFKVWNEVPYLMEFNGRFFGSIELSRKNGIDLPQLFYKFCFLQLPVVFPTAKIGVRARNLHDETLQNLALLAKGKVQKFLFWMGSVLKTLVSPFEIIEDSLFADPGFVFAQYRYDVRRILLKRKKKKHLRNYNPTYTILNREEFQSARLVFVCKGNICRSPFAEAYAKHKGKTTDVSSVGTFVTQNRLSPLQACRTAAEFGCDISEHQSRYLSSIENKAQLLYVVMDKQNHLDLIEMGVEVQHIRFLCTTDIADPYKKGAVAFKRAYQQISEAINKLTV